MNLVEQICKKCNKIMEKTPYGNYYCGNCNILRKVYLTPLFSVKDNSIISNDNQILYWDKKLNEM